MHLSLAYTPEYNVISATANSIRSKMRKFPNFEMHLSEEGIKTNTYALAIQKNNVYSRRANEG